MTAPLDAPFDRRAAALVVEEALGAVFDPTAVAALRADSPLDAVGLVPGDLVALGDAIALAAALRERACVLDDAELAEARTVADLVDAVLSAAGEAAGA